MHSLGQASNDRNCNPLMYLRFHINFNRRVSRSQENEKGEENHLSRKRKGRGKPLRVQKESAESNRYLAYPRTRTVLKFSTTRPPSRGRPKFVCGRKRENIMI